MNMRWGRTSCHVVHCRLGVFLDVKLEDVVEAVESSAEGYPPSKLHNLRLAEMDAQAFEDAVAHPVGVDRNRLGKLDYQPVLLVELLDVLVVQDILDRVRRHAGDVQHGAMVGDAVIAGIQA